MKLLIGSYDENIYEVTIDVDSQRFIKKELFASKTKPSYITPYKDDIAYIYMEEDIQFAKIGKEKVSLKSDTSCHINYDKRNNVFYTSHYHSGILNVLSNNEGSWIVKDTLNYKENSKIHFAEWIDFIELTGVCDLGDDKLHLYQFIDNELRLKTSFEFPENSGPRHFVSHHSLPIIYVVTEYSSKVFVLEYKKGKLNLLHTVSLEKGDSAAIRITNDSKFLYASDRKSNTISGFEVLDDGFLIPIQVISTFGDHPRDFNISLDERWLVAANMNSNNLTLYSRDLQSGSLILVDEDFEINSPATVLFT